MFIRKLKKYHCAALALILALALVLAGCSSGQPAVPDAGGNAQPGENTQPGGEDAQPGGTKQDAAEAAFEAVLRGESAFYSTDAGKDLTIDRLAEAVSSDEGVTASAQERADIDLDGDGVTEAVLRLSVNGDADFGFEVLRCHDGAVYGYTLWYRAFMDLKADGTFRWSGGASNGGYGRLDFDDASFETVVLGYTEHSGQDGAETLYYIDGEAATEEEYAAFSAGQDEKPGAVWSTL